MDNRRAFARLPYTGTLEYPVEHSAVARAFDISRRGVGFTGPNPVPVGQLLEIVLMNRNVVVKGYVRHIRPEASGAYRVGVEFDDDQEELVNVLLETSS